MIQKRLVIFVLFFVALFNLIHKDVLAGFDLNQEYQKIQEKIQKNPKDLNLQMDLAYLYTQGMEHLRALKIYEEVLTIDSQNKRATNELCVLYTQMRVIQKAENYCQKATLLSPDNYLVYDNLGLSSFKLGQHVQSIKPFIQALSLEGQSVLVKYHLANVFLALKEYDIAKMIFEKLGVLNDLEVGLQALIQHGLYVTYMQLKDYSNGLEAINKTYHLTGNNLYLGKVIVAYIKNYQLATFIAVSLIALWFCHYFGQRLNRFLKNE